MQKLTAEQCASAIVAGLVRCTPAEGDVYVRGGLAGSRFVVIENAGHSGFRIGQNLRNELERAIARVLQSTRDSFLNLDCQQQP